MRWVQQSSYEHKRYQNLEILGHFSRFKHGCNALAALFGSFESAAVTAAKSQLTMTRLAISVEQNNANFPSRNILGYSETFKIYAAKQL